MSMQPQGPGWWRASDGRWYPPQPRQTYPPQPRPAYPPQPFGAGPPVPQKKSGGHGVLIAVLIVVAVVLVAGVLSVYFVYRTVSNSVSDVVGGGELNCPSAADISTLVGSEVNGPTGGNMVVASRLCAQGATASHSCALAAVSMVMSTRPAPARGRSGPCLCAPRARSPRA
jgi:hypothetical protein